jgi:hypothetical protein
MEKCCRSALRKRCSTCNRTAHIQSDALTIFVCNDGLLAMCCDVVVKQGSAVATIVHGGILQRRHAPIPVDEGADGLDIARRVFWAGLPHAQRRRMGHHHRESRCCGGRSARGSVLPGIQEQRRCDPWLQDAVVPRGRICPMNSIARASGGLRRHRGRTAGGLPGGHGRPVARSGEPRDDHMAEVIHKSCAWKK